VVVEVPRALRDLADWRVRAGSAEGAPGERVPAPTGDVRLIIEGVFNLPVVLGAARVEAEVRVEGGRVTRVSLAALPALG
jgi:hypothetical protein